MQNYKMIREPECKNLTGLSRTTRWRMEKSGQFPSRRQISEGTVGWLLTEIEEWLKNRVSIPQNGRDNNEF